MLVVSTNPEDLPPPPYSSEDPHASTSPSPGVELPASTALAAERPTSEPDSTALPVRTSLRGGYIRPIALEASALSSAAAYFDERPCTGQFPNFVLRHQIILESDVTREDLGFPQPEDRYRARDVSDTDWSTFVNYLLPEHHLGPLNDAAKYDEKKKKRPVAQINSPESQEHIELVVGEWNSGFFGPRGIHVYPEFATPAIASSRGMPAQSTVFQSSPTMSSTPMPYGASTYAAPPISYPQTFLPDGQAPLRDPQNYPRQQSHRHLHRSRSSSSSSSSASIPSISSTDLEGTTPTGVSNSLNNFRHSPTKFTNVASSVRQLRDDLRSQRRPLSKEERKQQGKEFKELMKAQKKEIKKEVKSVIKEIIAMKKEEKLLRGPKAGGRDCEIGAGSSSTTHRAEPSRPEPARQSSWREVVATARGLAHQHSLDASARGRDAAFRAHERAREAGARGLQHGLDASARAREQALDAQRSATRAAADAHTRASEATAAAQETAANAQRGAGRVAEDAQRRAARTSEDAQRRAARAAEDAHLRAGMAVAGVSTRDVEDAERRSAREAEDAQRRAVRAAADAHMRAREHASSAQARGVAAAAQAQRSA